MILTRAFRVKLCPTPEQAAQFKAFADVTRYIWNWGLAERQRLYAPCARYREALRRWQRSYAPQWERRREALEPSMLARIAETQKAGRITGFEQMKQLTALLGTPQGEWLRQAPREAMNAALQNLDQAFANAFSRLKRGELPGFPHFHKKARGSGGFKFLVSTTITDRTLTLPKVGEVAIEPDDWGYLPIGKRFPILSGAVTCQTGKRSAIEWFVSVTVAIELPDDAPLPRFCSPRINMKKQRDGVRAPYMVVAVKGKRGRRSEAEKAGEAVAAKTALVSLFARRPSEADARPLEGTIGVHMGIRRLATVADSNGALTVYANPKHRVKAQRRIEIASRRMARCKKGSSLWRRTKFLRLGPAHAHVANQRLDAQHKMTTDIVLSRRPKKITIESWDTRGMMMKAATKRRHRKPSKTERNRRAIARMFGDAAVYQMLTQITYKAGFIGATVEELDAAFPSSQMCSSCGTINPLMKRGKLRLHCTGCGTSLDRDDNAGLNILHAPHMPMAATPEEVPTHAE